MARIPEAELERIKHAVPLEALARASGVTLTPHGSQLRGRCPFHSDKTPSLVITPQKNLWNCLGACAAGGSAIDWVMHTRNISFRHAVEILRAEADGESLDTPPGPGPDSATAAAALPPVITDPDASDAQLLDQVTDYYHQTLLASPAACDYLARRGLPGEELIRHFRLGFADRTLTYRLAREHRDTLRKRLTALGIFREKTGHEHLNGCLTIPVFNEHHQVAETYGRRIGPRCRPGSPQHLYLPGPHRGVFNHAGLQGAEEVILCEALLDALTFWAAGFTHVTASFGVNGFTDELRAALLASGACRILIAYDNDTASNRAADTLTQDLKEDGLDCYRVSFPAGMDANTFATKVTPAAKSLGLLLRQARFLSKGTAAAPVATDPTAEPLPPLAAAASTARESAREAVDEETAAKGKSRDPSGQDCKTIESPPPMPAGSPAVGNEPEQPAAREAPASPEPPAPRITVTPIVTDTEVVIPIADRSWRIRGLEKNTSLDHLRVNCQVASGDRFHVDTLDLMNARPRIAFLQLAAHELACPQELLADDLRCVLLELDKLQATRAAAAAGSTEAPPEMLPEDRRAALELLQAPDLLERILADFTAVGVVGEETNKLMGYLATLSRKLDDPLALIVQSTSAAGKSALMDAVLHFVPPEDRVQYSAMTSQSLFYMGQTHLKHKVLAVSEEEGAERASYALKLLQSEGELSIASTGKDPKSGRLITHQYHVEGPVALFLTTTAHEIDEELLNRALVLTVDEDREQTRAIHRLQRHRETLQGQLARRRKSRILRLHQNAQRLLRPLLVANPYAERLTFLDASTRTRRDHTKYLALIRILALLHQYQRPLKITRDDRGDEIPYIEVTPEDIQTANRLAREVLGRSLDELPPQTRRLLGLLEEMITQACQRLQIDRRDHRFTRRDVRLHTGWGDTESRLA